MRFLIRLHHHHPLAREWDKAGSARLAFDAAGIRFTRLQYWYESELVSSVPNVFRDDYAETIAVESAFSMAPSAPVEFDPTPVESQIPEMREGNNVFPDKSPTKKAAGNEPGGLVSQTPALSSSAPRAKVAASLVNKTARGKTKPSEKHKGAR